MSIRWSIFSNRDRHFSRRRRRRPPRTMLTTITTIQTTQTTSKGRRRRRRVAMRAMRSSVDARFDEASSSSSSSEASGVHVVSPGDSLYGVAVHYGVDPRDLIVRRRDFLPSFLSSSSAFFFLLEHHQSSLSATTSRERVFSLHFEFKWNAMTLTKRAGETDPPMKLFVSFSSIANTTNDNNRQRTRRRSAGSNTCYRDNDW